MGNHRDADGEGDGVEEEGVVGRDSVWPMINSNRHNHNSHIIDQ